MVSLACWRTLSFVVASRTMVAGRSWESSNGAVHRARCSDDADVHDISAAAGLRCAACMPVSFRKALAASEALLMQGSGRFRPQWHRAHWYNTTSRNPQDQTASPASQPAMAFALATTGHAAAHLQQRRVVARVHAARQTPVRQPWAAAAAAEQRRLRRLRAADPSSNAEAAPEVRRTVSLSQFKAARIHNLGDACKLASKPPSSMAAHHAALPGVLFSPDRRQVCRNLQSSCQNAHSAQLDGTLCVREQQGPSLPCLPIPSHAQPPPVYHPTRCLHATTHPTLMPSSTPLQPARLQEGEGLLPEEDVQIPGSYRDAMSSKTPLGKAVAGACDELDALGSLVRGCRPDFLMMSLCGIPMGCVLMLGFVVF